MSTATQVYNGPSQDVDAFMKQNVSQHQARVASRPDLEAQEEDAAEQRAAQQVEAQRQHSKKFPAGEQSPLVPTTKGHNTQELLIPTIAQMRGGVGPSQGRVSGIQLKVGQMVSVRLAGVVEAAPAMVAHVWGPGSGHREGTVNLSILRPDGTWGPLREAREDADGKLVNYWFVAAE